MLRLAGCLLRLVIKADTRNIGKRINFQNVETQPIKTVGWDFSKRTTIFEAATLVSSATRRIQRVIPDVRKQIACIVACLREITGAFERCRHSHAGRRSGRDKTFLIFLTEEEKQLIFVGIEYLRNIDWPTNCIADVALIKARLVENLRAISRNDLIPIVDPGVGVHSIVTAESIK